MGRRYRERAGHAESESHSRVGVMTRNRWRQLHSPQEFASQPSAAANSRRDAGPVPRGRRRCRQRTKVVKISSSTPRRRIPQISFAPEDFQPNHGHHGGRHIMSPSMPRLSPQVAPSGRFASSSSARQYRRGQQQPQQRIAPSMSLIPTAFIEQVDRMEIKLRTLEERVDILQTATIHNGHIQECQHITDQRFQHMQNSIDQLRRELENRLEQYAQRNYENPFESYSRMQDDGRATWRW